MNSKFASLALMCLVSFATHAGVKVTSLDLKTNGPNGYINVSLDGRSNELPDIRVYGKTIEIILEQAEAFNSIFKNVSGAQLSANVLNGKAIVKVVLPYNVPAHSINIGWRSNSFEVVFPRGKADRHTQTVTGIDTDRPLKEKTVPAPVTPEKVSPLKVENKVTATIEKNNLNKVSKDLLNEDYLNKLMKENAPKAEENKAANTEIKNDVISVKQAAIEKQVTTTKKSPAFKSSKDFSFAAYAAKFAGFLALVLGLFYGVVQVLKKGVFNRGKLGFLNNTQLIQVLSTTYISPKRSLMIVKAHKQIFLVANSESGLEFLSEMRDTTGLIKEGEKFVTGDNFDTNMGTADTNVDDLISSIKLKDNIMESTPVKEEKGLASLTAKDIVKFSDELKKKAKKLKPIEFN